MNTNELLDIARKCREEVSAMSSSQLDDWYKEHVGYRPTEDDPTLLEQPRQLQAKVVDTMFYSRLSAGEDTPGAEDVVRQLTESILADTAL